MRRACLGTKSGSVTGHREKVGPLSVDGLYRPLQRTVCGRVETVRQVEICKEDKTDRGWRDDCFYPRYLGYRDPMSGDNFLIEFDAETRSLWQGDTAIADFLVW